MFVIKKIQITDKNKEILNVNMLDKKEMPISNNYTTLILGENGVGKSFLLKSIIDIFLFLEYAQTPKRKPRYQYENFCIEYQMGSNNYCIVKEVGVGIIAKKNGYTINYKNIELPKRILALSFMVNDKFQFTKDNKNDVYIYHGVRSSTNSTYTSSITRSVVFDLIDCIKCGFLNEIAEIFTVLQFDPIIEFEIINGKKEQIVEKVQLDSSKDIYFGDYNKWHYPTIYFYKNSKRISFDSCSSGEKHLLFAYLGILSRINDRTLILIDEPEISLHPEWQIKYISTLNKLFGKYKDCHFILASHSHYFVSELKAKSSTIVVLRENDDLISGPPKAELIPYDTYAWSAENIIYNVFGIRTTRNYYFECDLSYLIQSLESFDRSEEKKCEIEKQINKLKKYVYHSNDPLNKLIEEAEDKIK